MNLEALPFNFSTYPDRKVAFALSYSLFVCLPLVRPAGLRHVGGLLPAQALTQLIHLHALKLSVAENKKEDTLAGVHTYDEQKSTYFTSGSK